MVAPNRRLARRSELARETVLKYLVLIPDGGADKPLPELGGRTPFDSADTPNLDALAKSGSLGIAKTTPPGFEAGSDVCSMSLLGYDPARYHTGRAPLEAASMGLRPGPSDWIFRLNLVTTGRSTAGPYGAESGSLMIDHSAGAISDAEARELVAAIGGRWQEHETDLVKGLTLTPGVSYRNILIDASGRTFNDVLTTPPHAVPGEKWEMHLPRGGSAASALERIMRSSIEALRDHPVNRARVRSGKRPATMAWVWGQGVKPSMPSFLDRFGLRGAMITAVDLLSGIAAYMGWDRLNIPGVTSYHDTDYAAQGRAAIDAITSGGYDIACCHVEAPDEASHQADWKTKVASIESIDRLIAGPMTRCMQRLAASGEGCRLLVLPHHYTLVSNRKHDATPVPFLMAGTGIQPNGCTAFSEKQAESTRLVIEHGHQLMEQFLGKARSIA
ncbi:MAG: cofactor-independent phosphoglycerate mutase [Phycisphaerales bacterium]